jgi:chemotaxis protein MotB
MPERWARSVAIANDCRACAQIRVQIAFHPSVARNPTFFAHLSTFKGENSMRTRTAAWALAGLMSCVLAGCGHSEEEMAEKQRTIDKLTADVKASQALHDEDQKKYRDAQADMEKLKGQLELAGVKSKEEMDRLQKALSEYKQRADQLAAIEQRFRDLRTRLQKLTDVGVKFVVRNNRMVIQLPGDILFDSGKDELKVDGKNVLGQVAEVIRNDKDLSQRNFQVAGHTDNAKYPAGGLFKDNWGLSLARARQVLLFLVTPAKDAKDAKKPAPGGGGLEAKRWAAAGYGETDPQEGTMEQQNNDQMKRNRRVELVLQPNVDEMINLTAIK